MKIYQMRFYKTITLLVFLSASISSFGQIVKVDTLTKWRKALKAGFNLNQSNFSSNWKAGGVNSIGFTAFLNYKANYKGEENSWDNEFDLLFGMINNQGQGYRKTLDRIFIDTKYGHKLNEKWDFALSANLISQFSKGYKYFKNIKGEDSLQIISDAFAPAFITVGVGVEYNPSKFFKLRISPIAPRITIANDVARFVTADNPNPYGISPGHSARVDWASAQILTEFNKDIFKNVNIKWRYILFANYEQLAINMLYHRMDFNLTAKVGKFINLNLGSILLYDHNQDVNWQFSQAFSLGVLYTFQNFADKK
jgi:hypothetical protein